MTMSNQPIARLQMVHKRFTTGVSPALENISAEIAAGQVTGLVGADGAGKSTLLRLMTGLLLPDEGRLNVCGYDPVEQATEVHRVVAYMPQRFGLYEDLTVAENLNLYADLRALGSYERGDTFARLLAFTGLAPFERRLAGALSGGMKQKLGLACALIKRPRLLLLDEPSVGVDPISRRELWHMVHELVDQGIGVVWSTAYLDEAERCASILLLSDGKLVYQGSPQEFTRRVEGRTFAVRVGTGDRRAVLSRALQRRGIVDGVIQGQSVRLVIDTMRDPPTPQELDAGIDTTIVPVAPRFEDAFIDSLGGSSNAPSPFGERRGPNRNQTDVAIEARNLTRRFGDFTATDRISFQVPRGEIFGLIGPNGAGKSTTFKMLCGLTAATSGTALVTGLDLARAPGKARARIGYMAQKFSLYGDLSVRQNLEFFAGIYGLRATTRIEVTQSMIDTFSLGSLLENNAGTLSLGYKQRLSLACATLHNPEVLFLDEPTSGVDPRTRREFWSHINAMVSTGVTIMVTTHFLDEAEYCDRVALIYRGRIIATGTPDALKAQARSSAQPDPALEDAFITLIEREDLAATT